MSAGQLRPLDGVSHGLRPLVPGWGQLDRGAATAAARLPSHGDLAVYQSILGLEFEAGGLSGLLDGQALDGGVTHMWAGNACLFR